MRYASDRMADGGTQNARLQGFLKRSDRNKWAESKETLIRELSPFPISYDVNCIQDTGFSEFTYTEFAGGIKLATQSTEINCRIMKEAVEANIDSDSNKEIEDKWKKIVKDKYDLITPEKDSWPEKVLFTPANNCLDLISWENLSRIIHEDDEVLVKPHPLIDDNALNHIAGRVGWNKIIPAKESGMEYMLQAKTIYNSSTSELTVLGALFDKEVVNIGNFFHEADGAYFPITREMFLSDSPKSAILAMVKDERSGLIFPWMSEEEIEARIKTFFDNSLKLRNMYGSLHVKFPLPKSE